MMKILSEIADSYGLHELHKKFNENNQFYYGKNEVEKFKGDYSKFYAKPSLPKTYFEQENVKGDYIYGDYIKGKLKFLSEVKNGPTNIEAIFHYNICVSEKNKDINVILIHGWKSDLNRLNSIFSESFISKGYNIYSYVLPFHLERASKSSPYDCFFSSNVNRTLKSVQQSISDIRALISYIKDKNKGKIIIIGLSIGGAISNLLSEVEENIDLLISLFYGNNFAFSALETDAGKYIKKELLKNNFNSSLLNENWSIINSSLRKPIIDLDKILLVSGKYDKYVLNTDTDKLWENWGKPKRKILKCGHSGIKLCQKSIREETLKFIEERV